MAGQTAWGPDLLTRLIFLTATGHYFATFVRAYGDRELFERFRTRFLLAPLVLLVTFVTMFASGNGPSLLFVTTAWAFWHWLAHRSNLNFRSDRVCGFHFTMLNVFWLANPPAQNA